MSICFGASIAYRHLLHARSDHAHAANAMRDLKSRYYYQQPTSLYLSSEYFCTRSHEWPSYKMAVADLVDYYSRWKDEASQYDQETANTLFRLALSCNYLGSNIFWNKGHDTKNGITKLLSPIPLFVPVDDTPILYIANDCHSGLVGLSFLSFRIGTVEEIIDSTAMLCSIMSRLGDEPDTKLEPVEEPCVGIFDTGDDWIEDEEDLEESSS